MRKVAAFQRIFVLWRGHFEKLYLEMFPLLHDLVAEKMSIKNTIFLSRYLHRLQRFENMKN